MLKEFFGFGGYERSAEGFLSWQHLLFVSIVMMIMVACALVLGLKNKTKDDVTKNKVLIISAILIDSFEIFKIIRNTFLKPMYLATKKCWNYLFRLKIIDISARN